MENISPQSKRLKEFVDLTGYSLNEFAKQCEIASVRTIAKIITEGATPTSKVLEKIIARFPQLNHDWVVLGYGEMIVKGLQTQETSVNSLEKSSESSFQYIIQALRDHDFALNETSISVEKANQKIDTTASLVIETVGLYRKEQKERSEAFFDKVDSRIQTREKFVEKELQGIRNNAEKVQIENRALIERLDHERKERNQENFDKLSRKIHEYLKETRELQQQLIKQQLDQGVEDLKKALHEEALKQTDFAIKSLLEKFSLKKLLPNLGSHNKVYNPKHQK